MQNDTPSRRLPPLNAVRAFEAAARHGNFTRAAEELSVTQGAVSHQVKMLEDWFGFELFSRHKREVHLTEKGEGYLPFIRSILNELHAITQSLMNEGSERSLCISTTESFAVNWLIPRLGSFYRQHPEYEVRLTSQNRIDDLGNVVTEDGLQWVDLRIRYGRRKWSGLHVAKLFDEEIFPVCSPALITNEKPLATINDLHYHTLIHDDMQMSWETWLRSAGAARLTGHRGPRFSHSHMALQAAVGGRGMALGRSILVADYLDSGQLVRPIDISLPSEHSYYLLCQERMTDNPKTLAFRNWLMQETRTFRKKHG